MPTHTIGNITTRLISDTVVQVQLDVMIKFTEDELTEWRNPPEHLLAIVYHGQAGIWDRTPDPDLRIAQAEFEVEMPSNTPTGSGAEQRPPTRTSQVTITRQFDLYARTAVFRKEIPEGGNGPTFDERV